MLIDFTSCSITRIEFGYLLAFCNFHQISRVLEFGPGASTCAFSSCCEAVDSIEMDASYFTKAKERWASTNVRVHYYGGDAAGTISGLSLPHNRYDFAFVDGPSCRVYQQAKMQTSRLNALEYVSQCSRIIALHDTKRPGERNAIKVLESRGWKLIYSLDIHKGLSFLMRDQGSEARTLRR